MSRMLITLAAMVALVVAARAQTPAPPAASEPSPPAASPAPGRPAAKPDGAKAAVGDTATEQSYEMKGGGMYQPPARRPASPAMDIDTYGRT